MICCKHDLGASMAPSSGPGMLEGTPLGPSCWWPTLAWPQGHKAFEVFIFGMMVLGRRVCGFRF